MAFWRWRGWASPQRLARAAPLLLTIRALEGLIAAVVLAASTAPAWADWRTASGLCAYAVLNLAVCHCYRRGAATPGVVTADVVGNSFAVALSITGSGGPLSALLPLLPLRSIPYALVWGRSAGATALMIAGGVTVAAQWTGRLGWWTVTPHDAVFAADQLVALAVVETIVSGALPALWLGRALDGGTREGLRIAADRPAASTTVTNALLALSEAIRRRPAVDDIVATVAAIAPAVVEADQCDIALWVEEDGGYYQHAAPAAGIESARGAADGRLTADEAADCEWARRLGHCTVMLRRDGRPASENAPDSVLIAPLVSGPRFFGVMALARRTGRTLFTHRDMRLANGIASQVAMALECSRLVEEGSRLLRALDSTDEAVLITDAERRIIFANPALLRTLGVQREQVIGRDALELATAAPEALATFQAALAQRSWRGETTLRRSDGSALPIRLNASLIRDVDGRVQGAVAILQDVAEEKRLHERLQRADRLAAVGQTAAGIAHEINNALTAILGQTADAGALPAERLRDALERVDTQARRIEAIVQGVLDFARPRPLRSARVDLPALAARTLQLVRHDLGRHGVQLETEYPPDLPPVDADPEQVQQVLLNLFTNAIQAMAGRPDGRLRVEAVYQGDRLALRIIDNGPGIAPDALGRVFDPFYSTKVAGSGLGLSVSYAIARAHRGDLRVESAPGRGATFILLLPSAVTEAASAVERALLVDDDPDVAEALAAMLAKEGLRTTRAATAAEGMALLEAEPWDAVFLDVRLPDLPGPEIYRRLADSNAALAQRVVFVTGGVWRGENHLHQELLPRPVLPKPCTQEQVRDVVRYLRAQRRAAA